MRRIALLVLALCSGFSGHAYAGNCPEGEHSLWVKANGAIPHIATDERMLAELRRVIGIAGVQEPLVCEFQPTIYPVIHIVRSRTDPKMFPLIMLPKPMMDIFTDEGMRGTLAHEISHIVRGPRGISKKQVEREEVLADLQAIQWVGRSIVMQGIREAIELLKAVNPAPELQAYYNSVMQKRTYDLSTSK